jgi:hypothetical protein
MRIVSPPIPPALLAVIGLTIAISLHAAGAATTTPERLAEVRAARAKTALELQPYRQAQVMSVPGRGGRTLRTTLIDLHPAVNSWHLLVLDDGGNGPARAFHLENPEPERQHLLLDDQHPEGITLIARGEPDRRCPLWRPNAPSPLDAADPGAEPYVPLCGGLLYLRRAVQGHRTNLERFTEILRDNVWQGERIITSARELLLQDRDLERARLGQAAAGADDRRAGAALDGEPAPASLNPGMESAVVTSSHLGVELQTRSAPAPGRWYRSARHQGVWVSLIKPGAIAASVLRDPAGGLGAMDAVESGALTYLLAFDLSRHDLGFAMGTDHPRVGWSGRPPPGARNDAIPGPDGIDSVRPLVMTGMVSPAQRGHTVAAFTGGFKRHHGAFKYGRFAQEHHGSHYGFVESGVTLSRLLPGLATLLVRTNGQVEMKTWVPADDATLDTVHHARQNGVALVEPGGPDGAPVPGALVAKWGPGNWSGSHDSQLRTMRAGACLQESAAARFFIYAVFTSATPRALARVFQAYGCRYAMQLDMNALEHTYAAVYDPEGSKPIQHLIEGMGEVDKVVAGKPLRRFVDYPDNRDFFYLTLRR